MQTKADTVTMPIPIPVSVEKVNNYDNADIT